MNQVTLIGRIANDIEVNDLENGKKVCNFSLAVDRPFKNANGENETDFFDCTAWNNVAVNTAEYTQKGNTIAVKGHLQMNTYEKDGQKHKKVTVIADSVKFLQSKDHNKSSQNRDER